MMGSVGTNSNLTKNSIVIDQNNNSTVRISEEVSMSKTESKQDRISKDVRTVGKKLSGSSTLTSMGDSSLMVELSDKDTNTKTYNMLKKQGFKQTGPNWRWIKEY